MPISRKIYLLGLVALFSVLQTCFADESSDGFEQNPILAKQPPFARSLPVQILLTGIVFTLTAVLLVHLVFTAQYHWFLAPVNYGLQLSSVLTFFISLIATIIAIFSQTMRDSQKWPYMLTYLAIQVPPTATNTTADNYPTYGSSKWNTAELASWYIMDATTSALVQITHIQFLTLLYPSRLEERLILGLLAPLAVASAAMELLPIHQNQKVLDIADTVRNTCNAALSLLFTAALFIWGFLINRRQAWRTDGGTAAFGAGALTLALVSTFLNFLYIPTKDDYNWMPQLIWAVVQWQSFLGWWWWVGGGRGIGEVEELIKREQRRERRRKSRAERKSQRKERAQALWKNASETLRFGCKPSVSRTVGIDESSRSQTESIEMMPRGAVRDGSTTCPSTGPTSTTSATGSGVVSRLTSSTPFAAVVHFYHLLRRAHLVAAHSQAIERMRRRRRAYAGEAGAEDIGGIVSDTEVVGWGLGSFGIRDMERREMTTDRNDQENLVNGMNDSNTNSNEPPGYRPTFQRVRARDRLPPPPVREGWSILWWGPLRRWRLQDSTSY